MGLDIMVGREEIYRRSYISFGYFRDAIANAAGYPLYSQWRIKSVLRDPEAEKLWPLVKQELKGSPLRIFLLHSDCDGYLGVNTLKKMTPILESLIDKIEEKYKEELKDLLTGINKAISLNKKLEFC